MGSAAPRAELGIAEVEEVAPLPRGALDLDRRSHTVVDQVSVGEPDVRFTRAGALLVQAIAQSRYRGGYRHHDLGHGFAVQVAEGGPVHLDIALAGGAMRFARTYEEVGAKAIVFDQECGPVEQASEELDDRATVPHPIGGLEDQAFVLGVVRHGTVDPGPQGRGEMNSRTFPAGSLTHIWPRSAPASTISRPCCFRRSRVFS